MRTLSATLLAAQKEGDGEPLATVTIDDRHIGIFRPRWEEVVEDTVADGIACAGYSHDGAFLRARVDPLTHDLYVQRVEEAANPAQWTSWTLLENAISGSAAIALAYDGEVRQALFFVAADGRTIRARESVDNGRTWQAAQTVLALAAGRQARSLAASMDGGSGAVYLFYSDEATTPGDAGICWTVRGEQGGEWAAPRGWGRSARGVTYGLACEAFAGAFHMVLCHDGLLSVFSVPREELDDWPAPNDVLRSQSPAITYRSPSISFSFGSHYAIYFTEKNSRAGYERLQHIIVPDWQSISFLARPYELPGGHGANTLADTEYHYLCTSRCVWRARRWLRSAEQYRDVSADVLALALSERLDTAGKLRLVLRNDDGRYAAAGAAGGYQSLRPGSQVVARLGYRTAAGAEVSPYRPYWITRLVHRRAAGRSQLVIEAGDGWALLERRQAPRAFAWQNRTVGTVLGELLGSMGFCVRGDGNAAWQRQLTRFSINPGMELADAVRRLLRLAGGELVFRYDAEWEETYPTAIAYLAVPAAPAPATAWLYGGQAGQPVLTAEHGQGEQETTHVIVLGESGALGEALDWAAVELGNEDRVDMVVDRRADLATAAQRAVAALATARRAAAGYLAARPNVGLEVLDALLLDDELAGLSDAPRRVVAGEIVLDRQKGVWEQKLWLGRTE